jgi:hypothetical protein
MFDTFSFPIYNVFKNDGLLNGGHDRSPLFCKYVTSEVELGA